MRPATVCLDEPGWDFNLRDNASLLRELLFPALSVLPSQASLGQKGRIYAKTPQPMAGLAFVV